MSDERADGSGSQAADSASPEKSGASRVEASDTSEGGEGRDAGASEHHNESESKNDTESVLGDASGLRQEIVESQKLRSDFLKWKLVGVGALGAAGLGLGGTTNIPHAYMVLPIIPLVCLYIDLLCWHNTLRILVIAAFLRSKLGDGYEDFVRIHARSQQIHLFIFEDWVLDWSTYFISTLVVLGGIFVIFAEKMGFTLELKEQMWLLYFAIFSIASGFVIIVLTWMVKYAFSVRQKHLDSL